MKIEHIEDIRLMGVKLSDWADRLNEGEFAVYRGDKYVYYVHQASSIGEFKVKRIRKDGTENFIFCSKDWVYAVNHLYRCTAHNPTDYSKRPRVIFVTDKELYVNNWKSIINNNTNQNEKAKIN